MRLAEFENLNIGDIVEFVSSCGWVGVVSARFSTTDCLKNIHRVEVFFDTPICTYSICSDNVRRVRSLVLIHKVS